jgi:hypothetical protein
MTGVHWLMDLSINSRMMINYITLLMKFDVSLRIETSHLIYLISWFCACSASFFARKENDERKDMKKIYNNPFPLEYLLLPIPQYRSRLPLSNKNRKWIWEGNLHELTNTYTHINNNIVDWANEMKYPKSDGNIACYPVDIISGARHHTAR